MPEPRILMTGIALGESPRWHDGRLWFSDWGAQEVIAVDPGGKSEVVARVPTFPFCIDFLPDGRLLIVSGREGLLLRREPDGSLVTHADLTRLAAPPWNDIVADGRGNIFVNNLGFAFGTDAAFAPGTIVVVTPDGKARQVADGLAFPNGMAVTPDNTTLIVAESYGERLTAFDIAANGSLTNRRTWAETPGDHPDGICLDAEGAVWYGDVGSSRCVRVREGGAALQTVTLDRGCFACMLGGANRKTLYMVAAKWPDAMSGGERTGQVLALDVQIPGAGWP
ncbi:MAG TPA: SMP-30/gluconolactonase/LRE family protein [Ktedonobacterales bacterium]|nr:SMP-30/gluconolactonase/LRE family protein [Ktedonobacterales bacterium]